MTSTSSARVFPQNESHPSAQVLADFFAKFARFEDSMLTQQHPRYRLPPVEVERLTSALSPASFVSSKQTSGTLLDRITTRDATTSATKSPLAPHHPSPGLLQRKQSGELALSKPAPSKIDPVLLTKSHDLVKAELNLKRIRIEKSLKELANTARRDLAKDKDLGLAVGPIAFDTARVLETARSLVKPQSGFKASNGNDESLASSSCDEASYYSSQVNSWTQSPGDKAHAADETHTQVKRSGELAAPLMSSASRHEPSGATAREPRVSGLGPRHNENVSRRADKLPQSIFPHTDATDSSGNSQTFMRDVEDLREESYSPPGITDYDPPQSLQHAPNLSPTRTAATRHHTAQIPDPPLRSRESESYSPPPPPQVPVVQNHLTAPLAPQPSRISPIALAHVSESSQNGSNCQKIAQQTQNNAKQDKKKAKHPKSKEPKKPQHNSEPGPRKVSGQQSLPAARKRRRETENEDELRRSSGHRAVASLSPVPYIKQEPMSPPLTGRSTAIPPRRLILRDDGRAEIEVMSPRHHMQRTGFVDDVYTRLNSGRPQQHSQLAPRHVLQEPIVIDESEEPSPVLKRRSMRDDNNLRRLASLQYAAAPYSPIGYAPQHNGNEQQYSLPTSHTATERPLSRLYHYYEEPEMSVPVQSRSLERRQSPVFRNDDDYVTQIPRMKSQPPPKRRIVVDQYGNEYIAVPARATTNHTYSREMSDFIEQTSPYRERGPPHQGMQAGPRLSANHRSLRRPTQVIELDDDEEDYRRMPPPPLFPRKRHVDVREESGAEAPYYTQRSASLQPAPPVGRIRQQNMPTHLPVWSVEEEQPLSARGRAYSARPNLAPQEDFYEPSAGWS